MICTGISLSSQGLILSQLIKEAKNPRDLIFKEQALILLEGDLKDLVTFSAISLGKDKKEISGFQQKELISNIVWK